MDNVSDIDEKMGLMDWEANGLVMEVMAAIGMEEVCTVEVTTILVGGGVGEAVVVTEVDGLI
ncbi:hypothetical protein KI387_013109, partial [Taxus chinensis]